MIGFRLISPTSDHWAVVTRSAKRPGSWQTTFGDALGPSGDSLRQTPHAALRLALDDGLILRTVDGGPEADAIASEVRDYIAAMHLWIDSDFETDPPYTPDWTKER